MGHSAMSQRPAPDMDGVISIVFKADHLQPLFNRCQDKNKNKKSSKDSLIRAQVKQRQTLCSSKELYSMSAIKKIWKPVKNRMVCSTITDRSTEPLTGTVRHGRNGLSHILNKSAGRRKTRNAFN